MKRCNGWMKISCFPNRKNKVCGQRWNKSFFLKKRFCTKKNIFFHFLHSSFLAWQIHTVSVGFSHRGLFMRMKCECWRSSEQGQDGLSARFKINTVLSEEKTKKCSMSHSIIDKVNGWKEEKKVNGWILSQIWKIHYNVYCIYLLRSRVT